LIDLPRHAWNLVHGASVALACFAVFHLCGLALAPRARPASPGRGTGADESPAVLGGAAYVLFCWFGIRRGIPLKFLIPAFAGLAALLVAVRFRSVRDALRSRGLLSRLTAVWLSAFVLFYALGYGFFTPDVSGRFLPLSTYLNNDLHWYLTFTRYLQDLGPSNVSGYSFLNYVYLQTPAVFYALGMFSVFFGREPLLAAMPMQFACTGLLGLAAARIGHDVFRIPRTWAIAFGSILVSAPFFRYVAGSYFLSTLLSLPILLHLMWVTIRESGQRRIADLLWLALRIGAHYVLLLFLYPVLLFAAIALQFVIVALTAIARGQSRDQDTVARATVLGQAGRTIAAMALAFVGLLAVARDHVGWALNMAHYLSQAAAGWRLGFISPLAILGFPGRYDRIAVLDSGGRAAVMAAACVAAAGLVALYFGPLRRRASIAERAWVGTAGGAMLAYCLYFLWQGPSYQQWKFASYSVLPLSFVVFAACSRLLLFPDLIPQIARPSHIATGLVTACAVVLTGGNLLEHALSDPPLRRWDGGLRNLALLDRMPSFRELDVQLEEGGTTMLAAYFVRSKVLHLVSRSYYPSEPVVLERVSRRRPYLIQNFGCEGVGHDETQAIPGVGCLLLGPPSVTPDTHYPFSRTFLAITSVGLGLRESWGRWNAGTVADVTFTADAQRMPIDRGGFLNLQLVPHPVPGLAARRLSLSWGAERRAETVLAARGWISLPVTERDWSGGPKLYTLTVSVATPDAVPLRTVEPGSVESRPLALGFEDVSLTTGPRGRVIAPSAAGTPR